MWLVPPSWAIPVGSVEALSIQDPADRPGLLVLDPDDE